MKTGIYGIGTDIIEVDRIKAAIKRQVAFRDKIFTEREIEYCESKRYKYQHYAARFAAKESFLKALGTGWRDGIKFTDIEVIIDTLGKPDIELFGRALEIFTSLSLSRIFLSISHEKQMAIAFVFIERY